MKITLKQSGGLAPVTRAPLVLDTADLAGEREEVEGLARAVARQPAPSGPLHPDEMSYTLVVAADDGTHEVHGTDTSASAEFSRLVQEVRSRGKSG